MSNTSARSQAKSISEAQPDTASLASVSRSTTWMSRPVSARARSRNSGALSASRQASVAIRPARSTRCRCILAAHTCSASMVRSMAASDSRPLADTPSPRRMMRENASMTLKPRRDGRATSRRQLLVPRSSAA